MNEQKNFIFEDMPGTLSRVVVRQDPNDPTNWIRDEQWYVNTRQRMSALFRSYEDNELLRPTVVLPDVSEVVLWFDDFSDLGKKLIMSQAIERWLGSFDRPGSKKRGDDVTYLQKQLAKLKSSG